MKRLVDRKETFAPLLLLCAALLLVPRGLPGLTADGTVYLQIARNVLAGDGLGWEASWAPPALPLLTALCSSTTGIDDLLRASGIVTKGAYLLLPPFTHLLARRACGFGTAFSAALLTLVSPHLVTAAGIPEPEIVYALFLVTAFLLLVSALDAGSIVRGAGAGILFAAASLSRSEGLLILFLVSATLFVLSLKQRSRLHVAVVCVTLVTACCALFPYLLFLKGYYKGWVLSPKSSYVMIWMKGKIYGDHQKGEVFNDELWGLTPDGRYRWQEPKTVRDLAGYLAKDPAKSLRVYLRNLSEHIPGRIPNNSGMEPYPQVYPLYLAIPALLTLFVPWRSSRYARAVLASPLMIVAILPIFTGGWWKYLVPYQPLVIVMGVIGLRELLERCIPDSSLVPKVLGGVVLLMAVRFLFPVVRSTSTTPTETVAGRLLYSREAEAAGKWAVGRFGRGRHYLSPWSKIVYHLDGKWTAEPIAPPHEVHRFARKRNVEIVVKEGVGEGYGRNDFLFPPPGFALLDLYVSPTAPYIVGFYAPVPVQGE